MRSSCCRNTSAQPYRGTHIYARINVYCSERGILVYFAQCMRRYIMCIANRIYAYSAVASPNENVFAQPYQNNTIRIRQCSGISAEWYREKRYRLPCAYNKYQNQTSQQIKLEFIIHFICIHVCMRKQIRRCKNEG